MQKFYCNTIPNVADLKKDPSIVTFRIILLRQQNHRNIRLEGASGGHLVQPPALKVLSTKKGKLSLQPISVEIEEQVMPSRCRSHPRSTEITIVSKMFPDLWRARVQGPGDPYAGRG